MKKVLAFALSALMCGLAVTAFAGCDKKVNYDIAYASWNLSTEAVNNIERRMIKAFEEETGYRVRIEEAISLAAYDDSLKILAGKNQLPDVYMLNNMHFGLSNEYVADLSAYVGEDADWDNIPAAVRNAVYYGDGVYAVPFALNMLGYFINTELFDEHMVSELSVFPTYEAFVAAVAAFAAKRTSAGIMGLSHEHSIFEWYPASVNDDLGWFTWDGEKYNLDSDAFVAGIEKTNAMYANKYSYDSLTPSERETLFPGMESYFDLWNANKLAIRWGGTYEIPDMLDKGNFAMKFIGVPGGRVPVVGDYLGISPVSEKPDVAYAFAKWMSFDPEGIAKRIALSTAEEFNALPLTNDAAVIASFFGKNNAVDGLKSVFEHIDDGIIESVKVIPGYGDSRWHANTGVAIATEEVKDATIEQLINLSWRGILTYSEYKTDINILANLQYANAVKGYAAKYSK